MIVAINWLCGSTCISGTIVGISKRPSCTTHMQFSAHSQKTALYSITIHAPLKYRLQGSAVQVFLDRVFVDQTRQVKPERE